MKKYFRTIFEELDRQVTILVSYSADIDGHCWIRTSVMFERFPFPQEAFLEALANMGQEFTAIHFVPIGGEKMIVCVESALLFEDKIFDRSKVEQVISLTKSKFVGLYISMMQEVDIIDQTK